jgi:hypothetical protein
VACQRLGPVYDNHFTGVIADSISKGIAADPRGRNGTNASEVGLQLIEPRIEAATPFLREATSV